MPSREQEPVEGRAGENRVGTDEPTDEALMVRLALGKEDALGTLVERYQTDIFRFCVHYLKDVERAKELSQETFLRVFTACGRFDETRKFRPWVLRIARNLCLNELKRRYKVPMQSLDEYAATRLRDTREVLRSPLDSPDEAAINAERLELLERALGSLNPDAREIMILRFFERMSAREIAGIVGSTEGAIRTKLHRILTALRGKFLEYKTEL